MKQRGNGYLCIKDGEGNKIGITSSSNPTCSTTSGLVLVQLTEIKTTLCFHGLNDVQNRETHVPLINSFLSIILQGKESLSFETSPPFSPNKLLVLDTNKY